MTEFVRLLQPVFHACDDPCTHETCEALRRRSAFPCAICGQPIRAENHYVNMPAGEVYHPPCFEGAVR
jgi:hypothetical protein